MYNEVELLQLLKIERTSINYLLGIRIFYSVKEIIECKP